MGAPILIREGMKFGQFVTTGRTRSGGTRKRRTVEVVCQHGVKKFVALNHLRNGHSASCYKWTECAIPRAGRKFGSLTTTGKVRTGKKGTEPEVVCPHGVRKFVQLCHLKNGESTRCTRWAECSVPPRDTKFGRLITTGEYQTGKWGRKVEVVCRHGNKKYVWLKHLKKRSSISCRNWRECGLTKGQSNHYKYLRHRTPRVKTSMMSYTQKGICVLCGNVRSTAPPNSREHFIPVLSFARGKATLQQKNAQCNTKYNIFGAHRSCNVARGARPLSEWWRLHPEYKQAGMRAIRAMRLGHRAKLCLACWIRPKEST